ncbi:hypothetical protein [Allomuricauda sp. F6463D]|uniref:hypothetical protein n=1 Tax=Allomuricauda sp. F6463D TaxID=2926409 RepID=UPI001FF42BDB|nr:hypothetical protein [Muricauda sp. F6463D]MCK0160187.1 hypothetical protein [Muricauda sp. F6463D]
MEGLYNFVSEHYIMPFYIMVWLVAVMRYRTYFDTPLKYYPIYLMYTFLTELLGYFIRFNDEFQVVNDDTYHWYNVIIYNIYSVISFMFFYYIYWLIVQNEKRRKWIKVGAVVSLSAYLISLFFQDPFYSNLYYADVVASMILLLTIGYYFKEKRSESSPYLMKDNLMFWTSLGLVIFHIFFPFLLLIGYEAPEIWIQYNLRGILKILILIMYGSFLVGVLFHKRRAFR